MFLIIYAEVNLESAKNVQTLQILKKKSIAGLKLKQMMTFPNCKLKGRIYKPKICKLLKINVHSVKKSTYEKQKIKEDVQSMSNDVLERDDEGTQKNPSAALPLVEQKVCIAHMVKWIFYKYKRSKRKK